jgi:putative oxidoreductase
MTTTTHPLISSRWRTAVLWTLQLLAAGMFLFAGTLKLSGAPLMVQMFGAIGLGQWFRYLTGGIEVVGAVLLFVPALSPLAAAVLALTMACAVLTHLVVLGGSPMVALLLFFATATIAWMRWSDR